MLRQDKLSVERREWYAQMQKPFVNHLQEVAEVQKVACIS
jgi:hypothetical protein